MQIIANVLGRRLVRYRGSGIGPAFGAARLARMAVTGEGPEDVCVKPDVLDILAPDPAVTEAYAERFETYSALYRSLRPEFHRQANALQ
jgi:xylulokinase